MNSILHWLRPPSSVRSPAARFFTAFLLANLAAAPALSGVPSCDSPNLTDNISTDVTYSGEVFIDQLIVVNNGGTLTIEAGTQVTMCNDVAGIHVQRVGDGGGLIAVGTPAEPIVFSALDPNVKWNTILLDLDVNPDSKLQHVVLNDGGGNDPEAQNAPLQTRDDAGAPGSIPTFNHVTINDSGAYGLIMEHNESDATPPSFSNITINNAARAAVWADAGALGNLTGNNNFTGNASDRIVVRSSLNASILQHSTWRDHGVPYELTGGISVRTPSESSEDPVRWTLEPGVTLLVHPGQSITIGSNTDAILIAEGTEEKPITITRLDDTSDYWRRLRMFGDSNSSIKHATISWGGFTTGDPGNYSMIYKTRPGVLSISDSRIEFSLSNGIQLQGSNLYVRNSVVTNNEGFGLYSCCGSDVTLRGNTIVNNLMGGISNVWPTSDCIDAAGNFWGDAGGPADDASVSSDECGANSDNDGFGDSVSAGVLYRPYLVSGDGQVTNRSQISAEPRFVIADGVSESQITVTVRDALGNPLSGKTVELFSTIGNVQQPADPTDANGHVTAIVTSMQTGFANISGMNVTDNDPISGLAGMSFWQGPGDTGGLIDPNGSPYARPQLTIDRPPFIVGFPMEFKLAMQNTQPTSLDVEVEYGIVGLNIGVPFTSVDAVNKTLAPGEAWDAPGFWLPSDTGHRCVQAQLTFGESTKIFSGGGGTTFRKNTDQKPCKDLNANNLIPTKGGLFGVIKHFFKAGNEGRKVNRCLNESLTFRRKAIPFDGEFTEIYAPPVLTPPVYTTGGEITPGLAIAMTEVSAIAAELSAIITANGVTRQRLQWASQAGSETYMNVQYSQFREYSRQEGEKLLEWAAALDNYLTEVTAAGIADELIGPDDQAAYLAQLQGSGFDQDTKDYLLDSGWDAEEITLRLRETISRFENNTLSPTSFYDTVRSARDEALADGNDLVGRYTRSSKAIRDAASQQFEPVVYEFQVGHDRKGLETVDLVVRPINLPINWTYELSATSVELNPAEVRQVTFTVFPASEDLSGETLELAVEGFIGNEIIGGIAFDYYTPELRETADGLFNDNFELK